MTPPPLLLANLILIVHVMFVAAVVLAVPLIYTGKKKGWAWVSNRWLRIGHVLALLYVVANTWFGKLCPLTLWENALRRQAGQTGYDGAFIAHWLRSVLYHDFPLWVFAFLYTAFAGLVVAMFWIVPVRWRVK